MVTFLAVNAAARGFWPNALAFASAATIHFLGVSQMYRGWKLLDKYGDLLNEEIASMADTTAKRAEVYAMLEAVNLHEHLATYAVREEEPGPVEAKGPDAGPLPPTALN